MTGKGTDADDDGDKHVLRALQRLVSDVDPVPAEVTAFAKAAIGWRRIDAELAELLADSALEAESLPLARAGVARTRSVTFRASDLDIDLEIRDADPGLLILGQLAPPAIATIGVQQDDGSLAGTTESDTLGRFRIRLGLSSQRRIRLRIIRQPPAPPVETSWIGT